MYLSWRAEPELQGPVPLQLFRLPEYGYCRLTAVMHSARRFHQPGTSAISPYRAAW